MRIKVWYFRWKPQWLITACSYWCAKSTRVTHPLSLLLSLPLLFLTWHPFSSSSPPPPSHNQVSNSTKWMDLEVGTIDCNAFCDRQVSADFQINCAIQPRELDLCGIAAFRNEPKDTRVAGCPIVATSCPKHPDSPTWCTSVWSLSLSCWQNNLTPNLTNWVQFLQNIPNSISKPFTKQRLDLITFVFLWQESFVSRQKLVQWV